MSGSTKTTNDLAPAGKFFRQIIPVGFRHLHLSASKILSLIKDPTFPHGLGVHGPSYPATSQFFTRDEEVALGMSFKTQSQETDIPSNVIPTPTHTPEEPYINSRVFSQAGRAEEAVLGQTFNA